MLFVGLMKSMHPAVQRGRRVNRLQGDPAQQVRERHDSSDIS